MVPSDLNPAAEAAGALEKALNNDEVFRCARSVHFAILKSHHSEYHPIDCNTVVQVGPPHTKTIRGRILKINDFRDSLLLARWAKCEKNEVSRVGLSVGLDFSTGKSNESLATD